MPMGHVNVKLPCLFAPFPGANPRLLQTQRDSSLSSCLQTANQEQCLTVRNNYLASFALSTFQIQKGDKATLPMAQARSPSRKASSAAGSSLILGEMCLWQPDERHCKCHLPPIPPRCLLHLVLHLPLQGPALVTNGPVMLEMPNQSLAS